jgi:hypothetical protein
MSIGPAAGLLSLLSAAVRPKASERGLSPEAMQGSDFASLLQKARSGEISSSRPVALAHGVDLKLSEDQLARLAVAADRAEAQGASRALVFIDGLALKLDVSMREITGLADMKAGGILTGIDAVIGMPPAGPKGPEVLPVPKAGAGLGNASLLNLLSDSRQPDESAA